MPASLQDRDKIRELQESAATRTAKGRGIAASSETFKDRVMKAVREDRTSRGVSRLATDVGEMMSQLVTTPEGIRERTRGIVDPTSVNIMTSKARAEDLRALGILSTERTEQEATMQESIQAGASRLKARAQELYAQAEQDTAQATAMESEWKRDFEERKFAADEAYRYRDEGEGTNVLQAFLGMKPTPTTPEPKMSAAAGTVAGEWVATGQDAKGFTKWEPVAASPAEVFSDPEKVAMMVMSDPGNATTYLNLAKSFEGEEPTAEEKTKALAVETIRGTAQEVIKVLDNIDTMSDEQFKVALAFAVSNYNKRGFEEGGQALTPMEYGVIAGTEINTRPGRQMSGFEKFWTGITPKKASTIEVLESPESIRNKMNAVILGASEIGTTLPESWKPD